MKVRHHWVILKLKIHIVKFININFVISKKQCLPAEITEDYLLDKCDVEVDEATEELLGEG